MEEQNAGLGPESLVKQAAQGHHDNVQSILAKFSTSSAGNGVPTRSQVVCL